MVTFALYSGNSDNIKERIERGLLDVGLLQDVYKRQGRLLSHVPSSVYPPGDFMSNTYVES